MATNKICPNCLSDMVAESIGWKCTKCLAFLDMQGILHKHKEKPFMPPQTNADRIRAMSDEEFVEFIGHNSLCDRVQDESGNWCNDHNCTDCLQEWLKQPAEEGAENE